MVDLQVFAHPRITLKPLVPTFPCFAKICVSLMEKVGDFHLPSLSCSILQALLPFTFLLSCIMNFAATCRLRTEIAGCRCHGHPWSLQICSGKHLGSSTRLFLLSISCVQSRVIQLLHMVPTHSGKNVTGIFLVSNTMSTVSSL